MRPIALLLLGMLLPVSAGTSAAPAITGFTPDHGPPGTLVKIIGSGFSSLVSVEFGGSESEFRVVADNHVKALVPAGAVTSPIRLETPAGEAVTARSFVVESEISSLTPRLDAPWPNPARGRTSLRFALPRAARARLTIVSPEGRLVRTLVDGPLPSGVHAREWDGLDVKSQRVRSGLYFASLAVGDYRLVRRILLVSPR